MEMTIDQVIAIGESLKAFKEDAGQARVLEAPRRAGPYYVAVKDCKALFGIGEHTIRALYRDNADFPALRLGTKILIDVEGLYDWLHARNGTSLMEE